MNIMSESTSIVSGRDRDCAGCRLISGSGLIGSGLYVAYHSQKSSKTAGKIIMLSIAATIAGLGVARILDLPPFRRQIEQR